MSSLAKMVDPFIGIDDAGRCLCGPYLPNSIVRLCPDTLYPQPSNGYDSNRPIVRFSHNHVSGTGGGGRYGNIGILPFTGKARVCLDAYEPLEEYAASGYYTVKLKESGIKVELTSTPRVGVHKYTFPAEASANILIDAGAVIQVGGEIPGENTGMSTGGFVEFISETEVVGRGDFKGGWGHLFSYSVYFYCKSDLPFTQRFVANNTGSMDKPAVDGPNSKAVASFDNVSEVNLRVGISYVSIAKARSSVQRETGNKDFARIREEALNTWEKTLSKIKVIGGTAEQQKLFYTLFTRLLCLPSDLGIDDENPLWESGVRHFTDYYALWDSVRNANSLIGLFDPELEVALLNCLLDVAGHIGWLPDAWIAGHSAMIQGGSSADVLICEAALKGLKGIDYEKALLQMRKNNEVESPDPWLYGRHLKEYKEKGYLSTNIKKNSVSRHMEYAYQDWCIGALAELLSQKEVAEDYFQSSQKIWNLWRDDIKFFAPRHDSGEWVNPFDPAKCLPDCWNDPYFYEGTSWQWSFSVHHDFAGLIARYGGNEAFVKHLDEFFDKGYYYSKETMLHIPYLYIYAGRPDKTAERVREYMQKSFSPKRDGLADNEDMGCQSAWYMCSAMGIYPIMGQDIYLLSTPVFERVEVALGTSGKSLVIEAPGAGAGKKYIRSAEINGKPLNRAWIRHNEISDGAVIKFVLGDAPGDWGTAELPPSPVC